MTSNNAILVYAEEGVVKHRFCPEAEARTILADVADKLDNGFLFAVDHPDAKLIYDISPDLRDHVAAAKTKLEVNTRLKLALDRHGIPNDRNLRVAIFKAFEDLTLH